MAEITWTDEACRWLKDIFEHIALEDPGRGDRVVLGIYERAQVLEAHPEIGYRYLPSERNVRILLYGYFELRTL